MCEPTTIAIASFGLSVLQQEQQYRAQKDQAAAQELKNKEARKSANRAYLSDLNELDRIKDNELRDAAKEKEGKSLELLKKQDSALLKGLESGNQNVEALLRDIGFDYQPTFSMLSDKQEDANISNIFGQDDEYSAMRRSYNKLPDVFQPSKAGLLIGIGSSAVGSYSNLVSGKYGKSKSSDLNPTSTEQYNKDTYGMSVNSQRALRGNY